MDIQVTVFANVKSTRGIPSKGTWEKLLGTTLAPLEEKPLMELWTPAALTDDKREAVNVQHVFALVLDFDGKDKRFKHADAQAPPGVEEILARWPYKCFWHYTRSHTDQAHCVRLVLPLHEPLSTHMHSELYTMAIDRELSLCGEKMSSIDVHTRDPARMWFMPPTGQEWHTQEGPILDNSEWSAWEKEESVAPAPEASASTTFDPESASEIREPQLGVNDARVAAYIQTMPPSIAGSGGHTAAFNVARKICDFGITSEAKIIDIMAFYFNPRCEPPWSEAELQHKAKEALKAKTKNPIPDLPQKGAAAAPKPGVTGYKPKPSDQVYGSLIQDEKGRILNRLHNYACLIHQSMASSVRFDDFLGKLRVMGPLPWSNRYPRDWTDVDDLRTCTWLERTQGIAAGVDRTQNAVQMVGEANSFDSYIDHVNALPKWDGTDRLTQWLVTYMGASDSEYTQLVGRAFLISMVARALRPGCKVDTLLVLEGSQGIGKSMAAEIIAGNSEWFSSSIPDLQSKDAIIGLQGKTIAELAELAAMKRSNNESTKEFITRSNDKYRPPFGRREVSRPRRCVFIATTNHSSYLTDETGNRRFWPVKCSSKTDLPLLKKDRDQLVAEAKVAFEKGETWYDVRIDKIAFGEQRKRVETDPWDDDIDRYIAGGRRRHAAPARFGDFISSNEILGTALSVDVDKRNTGISKRVSRMMRARGWSPTRIDRTIKGERVVVRGFTFPRLKKGKTLKTIAQLPTEDQEPIIGAEFEGHDTMEVEVDETVEMEPEQEGVDESTGSVTFIAPAAGE